MCFVQQIHYDECSHSLWEHRFCDTCNGPHAVQISSGSKPGACEECIKNQETLKTMNQFIIDLQNATKAAGLGKDNRRKLLAETGKDLLIESDSNEAKIAVIVEDVDMDKDSESDTPEWDEDVKELDQALFGSLEFLFSVLEDILKFRRVTEEDIEDLKMGWRQTLVIHASIKEEYAILLEAFLALDKVLSNKTGAHRLGDSLSDVNKDRLRQYYQQPGSERKLDMLSEVDHDQETRPTQAEKVLTRVSGNVESQEQHNKRDVGVEIIDSEKENHAPDGSLDDKAKAIQVISNEVDVKTMEADMDAISPKSIIPVL